jgi:hypothetical protein
MIFPRRGVSRLVASRKRDVKISSPIPYWRSLNRLKMVPPEGNRRRSKIILRESTMSTKRDDDTRANQLNDNNDAYRQSRGYDERPDDWEDRSDEEN